MSNRCPRVLSALACCVCLSACGGSSAEKKKDEGPKVLRTIVGADDGTTSVRLGHFDAVVPARLTLALTRDEPAAIFGDIQDNATACKGFILMEQNGSARDHDAYVKTRQDAVEAGLKKVNETPQVEDKAITVGGRPATQRTYHARWGAEVLQPLVLVGQHDAAGLTSWFFTVDCETDTAADRTRARLTALVESLRPVTEKPVVTTVLDARYLGGSLLTFKSAKAKPGLEIVDFRDGVTGCDGFIHVEAVAPGKLGPYMDERVSDLERRYREDKITYFRSTREVPILGVPAKVVSLRRDEDTPDTSVYTLVSLYLEKDGLAVVAEYDASDTLLADLSLARLAEFLNTRQQL